MHRHCFVLEYVLLSEELRSRFSIKRAIDFFFYSVREIVFILSIMKIIWKRKREKKKNKLIKEKKKKYYKIISYVKKCNRLQRISSSCF